MKRSVLIPPLLHRVEILIFAIGILVGGKLGDITVLSFFCHKLSFTNLAYDRTRGCWDT